jgi:CRISPR-associated protein Csb2
MLQGIPLLSNPDLPKMRLAPTERSITMPFVISASFPLGIYQGSDGSGEPEPYPSPDRLYKAFVSVAYRVFRFKNDSDEQEELSLSAIVEALAWLESNPPNAVRLPPIPSNSEQVRTQATVYRDKGVILKSGESKKDPAPASIATAYPEGEDGAIKWQWREEPSEGVLQSLTILAAEIPYLGEAASVARITTEVMQVADFPLQNSVILSTDPYAFTNDIVFNVPMKGRLQELQRGYLQAYPAKRKIAKKDKEEEKNFLANNLDECVESVGYMRNRGDDGDGAHEIVTPWPRGLALRVALPGSTRVWRPDQTEYVEWAVALHRFLVKQWGFGCSPYLTGKYAKSLGVAQPANNVSIQVVVPDSRMSESVVHSGLNHSISRKTQPDSAFFLLMIPTDMPGADYEKLRTLCDSVVGWRLYYRGACMSIQMTGCAEVDLTHLWKKPEIGMHRFWIPSPMGISETRTIPSIDGVHHWGAKEFIQMSLAHVWRNRMSKGIGSREQRYWNLIDQISSSGSGFRVFGAQTILRTNMGRYSHHRDASNILKGFSGLIEISGNSMQTAAAAIGQSRHLGGGFLVPIDIPGQLLDRKGAPSWIK